MAAPARSIPHYPLDNYELIDRYRRESGRVFLTGTQALVRIPLMQRTLDRAAGLNTAGFISGYRGSPLGAVDQELWRAKSFLDENDIEFLPAVNEDLAATAILGSQQVETDPHKTVDGVFGIWYGKGPGVDRAGDALKHGNAYGSSPHGGVLVVAGDLNPANVAEYLEYGLYGIALSRFSGMWVGFKAISETVESAMSLELPPYPVFNTPDYTPPPDGLHYRWPDLPGLQIEERFEHKKAAALAFAAANPIDRKIFNHPDARYGIVTTGKAHLDLMEALKLLGIDQQEARRIGLDVYKVGMVWPLEHDGALDFVHGKQEVLVVEEKRGIIESWLKEYFYDYPGRKPDRMVGKYDENEQPLVPWVGELHPIQLAGIVARRIDAALPGLDLTARADRLKVDSSDVINVAGATRMPYFCSGCPHNTSTRLPEGSQALAGIGCHFMASWMDRDTEGLIQMGGEGVNWISRSKFNGNRHIFQNLGDGTFYHSGSMAIRQAVAAGTNITFKILFNEAVAMTGGQPVDGPISVPSIAHSVRAEGIDRIALVSDDPEQFSHNDYPTGTTIHHRRDLDGVQRELREIPGVTILIYAQACATEKRRRRKRGTLEDPNKFVVINELVCEGCGDCSVESNCLSVIPKETPFGRKRQIDQSSCNKDYSCVNGFCPSFVTVEGGERQQREGAGTVDVLTQALVGVPEPAPAEIDDGYDLLVTGIGGTGVVTVGQLITMAAHLEGKGASVLDFMGFAQKFGTVVSFLRIASEPQRLNQVRIEQASADALIGCDIVVSSSPRASSRFRRDHTRALLNVAEMPTADFVQHRDANLRINDRVAAIRNVVGDKNVDVLDANTLATQLLGNSIYANVMMLGCAWQQGLVPVSLEAIKRAIELNGVEIETNKQAFDWGRVAAANPDAMPDLSPAGAGSHETLDDLIRRRANFLVDYQNQALADRYTSLVQRVRDTEHSNDALVEAVAKSYFKLLAYKDEYEVARLHTQTDFLESIREAYGKKAKVRFHMAPPLLSRKKDGRGRPRKKEFGAGTVPLLKLLASLRGLRGTPFDLFALSHDRRAERALIAEFEEQIDKLLPTLDAANVDQLGAVFTSYMDIRGYGPVKDEAIEKTRSARGLQ
jgi:indolepyruvate ferredoxin oxidoreductase